MTCSAPPNKTISHLQAILRLLDVNCTVIPCTVIDLGRPNSHIIEVQLRLVLQHAAELLQDFVFGMSESGYLRRSTLATPSKKDRFHNETYSIRDGTSFRILEEVLDSPEIALGPFVPLM